MKLLSRPFVLVVHLLGCSQTDPSQQDTQGPELAVDAGQASTIRWIDTHTHLSSGDDYDLCDTDGPTALCSCDECLERAFALLDAANIALALALPPPGIAGSASALEAGEESEEQLIDVVQAHPDRFVFGAGGGSLNSHIQNAVAAGIVTDEDREVFAARAREIADLGASAFGEMSILHITNKVQQYEEAPADHELFLLLSDIADDYDIPIDFHLVPLVDDYTFPPGSAVPEGHVTPGNIEGFERLLDYNADTRIVWAHVAWYSSPDMGSGLVEELLTNHSNLYMQIHAGAIGHGGGIVDDEGDIREEWLTIIKAFPDRVILGSDSFWSSEDNIHADEVNDLVNELPEEVVTKVTCANAAAVYNLIANCD